MYLKVYEALRKAIAEGDYPPGSALPSETELSLRYSVSRATARRALSLLEEDGLVTVRQGKGAYALSPAEEEEIDYSYSTLGAMDSRVRLVLEELPSEPVRMADPEVDLVKASAAVALALRLEEGDPVYRVQRIKSRGSRIVSYAVSYLSSELAPGLESCQIRGLYEFLNTNYKLRLDRLENVLRVKAADWITSELLKTAKGSPVFVSTKVAYSGKKPMVLTETYLAGDLAEYVISSEVID